jgi:hypothetical protein
MALTNAEKQARFRERNTVLLTAGPAEIADKLAMMNKKKLRKIYNRLGGHLNRKPRNKVESTMSEREFAEQLNAAIADTTAAIFEKVT